MVGIEITLRTEDSAHLVISTENCEEGEASLRIIDHEDITQVVFVNIEELNRALNIFSVK